MGRVKSNRKIAEALLKTLKHLESDPTVDTRDPAFMQLKCTLLQRLMSLELDTAQFQSSLHLVESPDPGAGSEKTELETEATKSTA
jgi:hypothetical protein